MIWSSSFENIFIQILCSICQKKFYGRFDRKNSMVDLTEKILWSIWQKKFYGRFDRKNSMVDLTEKILWSTLSAKSRPGKSRLFSLNIVYLIQFNFIKMAPIYCEFYSYLRCYISMWHNRKKYMSRKEKLKYRSLIQFYRNWDYVTQKFSANMFCLFCWTFYGTFIMLLQHGRFATWRYHWICVFGFYKLFLYLKMI